MHLGTEVNWLRFGFKSQRSRSRAEVNRAWCCASNSTRLVVVVLLLWVAYIFAINVLDINLLNSKLTKWLRKIYKSHTNDATSFLVRGLQQLATWRMLVTLISSCVMASSLPLTWQPVGCTTATRVRRRRIVIGCQRRRAAAGLVITSTTHLTAPPFFIRHHKFHVIGCFASVVALYKLRLKNNPTLKMWFLCNACVKLKKNKN